MDRRRLAALARGLIERGLAVVASEGPDPAERAYMDGLWGAADVPVARTHGRPDWASLAALLAGARLCRAGHFGHSSGGGNRLPDRRHLRPGQSALDGALARRRALRAVEPAGTIQHRGNVWVVQNPLPCLPCESSAAPATSTATANAWTSCPLGRCWRRSTWRCGAGRRQAPTADGWSGRPAHGDGRVARLAQSAVLQRRLAVSDFFGGKETSSGVYAALWH